MQIIIAVYERLSRPTVSMQINSQHHWILLMKLLNHFS